MKSREVNKSKRILSVVVPVFRNSQSLRQLFEEISDTAHSHFPQLAFEVVFVDDGSDDDSWQIIESIRESHPKTVSAHRLTRNFGQAGALIRGYELAEGDAVVSISADLQDPPGLIAEMVEHWLGGSDLVIAHRAKRSDGFLRTLSSRLAYAYIKKIIKGVPEGGFDYFLMSRRAVNELVQFRGRFRFLQGDLLWLGFPTTFIPYERVKRPHGKSGYSWRGRIGFFTEVIIDSSNGPLKLMSRLGGVAAAVGFAYSVAIAISWVFGSTPFSGWAPIMITILLMTGSIMVMLGLISSYLWRIYDQVRERPMSVLLESHPRLEEMDDRVRQAYEKAGPPQS